MKQALALLCLMVAPGMGQVPEALKQKLDEAERQIVRLRPTAFPQLPASVIQELQRRGCTIPQYAFAKRPENVIRGEFARPGQKDWAVLCSTKGTSTILVFWNGSGKNPSAIASRADRDFLQGIDTNKIAFSRGIAAIGKADILEHYHDYPGPKPPLLDHQGIDDAFLEKGSVTWYFLNGKLLTLAGSD